LRTTPGIRAAVTGIHVTPLGTLAALVVGVCVAVAPSTDSDGVIGVIVDMGMDGLTPARQ